MPLLSAAPLAPGDEKPATCWPQTPGSELALRIAELSEAQPQTAVVASSARELNLLEDELRFFLPDGDQRVCVLPGWECLPYDRYSPHPEITSHRIQTLERLCRPDPFILLLCAEQVLLRLPAKSFISGSSFSLSQGSAIDPIQLRERLSDAGYLSVSQVASEGEYAIRGGIIDVFPMGAESPFRLDLFGDEIENIRFFDPDTQKSTGETQSFGMLPAREFPTDLEATGQFRKAYRRSLAGDPQSSLIYREVSQGRFPAGIEFYLPLFFQTPATLFDYLPGAVQWVLPADWRDRIRTEWANVVDRFEHCSLDPERPPLSPEVLCLTPQFAMETIPRSEIIERDTSPGNSAEADRPNAPAQYPVDHKSTAPFSALVNRLRDRSQARVLLSVETPGRAQALIELLSGHDLTPVEFNGWQEFLCDDLERTGITVSPLDRGLLIQRPDIEVIVESQLYGERVHQRRRARTQDPEAIIRSIAELHLGDPVVHLDHGVGRFGGLQWLDINGQKNEFLIIQYFDNGKLYVPVINISVLSRYIGGDPENAPLHRLGSDQWDRAKTRAQKRAHDAAAELLRTQALRTLRPGVVYKVPQAEYMAFRSGFRYDETPDQDQAIDQVLADLGDPTPMDRLVCGDVGFGKTEVALRAAFVVAHSGHQVAVLTPTTLLANQHYDIFRDRFSEYPVRLECLSRFKTPAANAALVSEVREGKIDIVIGTHRLLQEDLDFRNLGLVIIDEEHRFGVRQKERLKQLRQEVDVLTLTATPIPRTLNIALAGMRSISLISSPPPGRVSIKTMVHRFSKPLIRESCLREMHRGGQVYFLHNDVRTIDRAAADLRALIPEATIKIGHGQMPKRQLESVMRDFYHQRFDILVCSTIIESGIDVPTANTIIMNRADKFGLAQLHQLRGRVGRSSHQAFAFLLVPDPDFVTESAKRRLEVIENLTELGTGFALANHDLEIRGAGELLGEGQSGVIEEIGFSMYTEYLNRAIRDLSDENASLREPASPLPSVEVDVQAGAYIPETFIPDVHARLVLYQRISNCVDESSLYELKLEMVDRFGLLPDETKMLFRLAALRVKGRTLGIKEVRCGSRSGRVVFDRNAQISPERFTTLLTDHPTLFRMTSPVELAILLPVPDPEQRAVLAEWLVGMLDAHTPVSPPPPPLTASAP